MNNNTQISAAPNFDTGLFAKTTHNPSFASLTKQFTDINGLRDYCIPVNPYFPPAAVMEKLQERIIACYKTMAVLFAIAAISWDQVSSTSV